MNIDINPRVTGEFVRHVMDDPVVVNLLNDPEATQHDIVKAVIIVALRDFKFNLTEVIKQVKLRQKTNLHSPQWSEHSHPEAL